ncbi:MAG: hypothetical protein FWC41_14065 [Firmicutes bacterium]|nr:hypothetical protein [Bacillota bacterium]
MKYDIDELARTIIDAIKDNTKSGKDRMGIPFKPYSENPLLIPYSGIYDMSMVNPNTTVVGWSQTKGAGIVWPGGYKAYKSDMLGVDTNTVDLTFTGEMLDSMTYEIDTIKENTFEIKITGLDLVHPILPTLTIRIFPEMQARAAFNIAEGRDFMGLPDDKLNEIINDWLSSN